MVVSQLPKAGLGNKLFVWAHGVVFASMHALDHMTVGWTQYQLGPLLRREKSKRWYTNYFINSASWLKRGQYIFQSKKYLSYLESNKFDADLEATNYVFHEIPHWKDYFIGLREHRELIKKKFFDMLSPRYQEVYRSIEAPDIAVHIRMGDFKKLEAELDFSKAGLTRTPIEYFSEVIHTIREITGNNTPVKIFSDGNKAELTSVLSLPHVGFAHNISDLADLLQMSKSKILVLSAGSTFGQWSGFLSDAILIHHPAHF
ncbi:MAG: alpha-1,2-fucosyltransferase, partial [Saprospiraceae bacterium]|nr:alpha-1,2-fucosyltransferase [Saprospiraceae bacterium]